MNSLCKVFLEARVDLQRTRLSLTSWRFPSFDVHAGSSAGSRWKKWLATFERLFTGMNVKIPKRKRALLLHYADPDVDEYSTPYQTPGETTILTQQSRN